MPEDVPPDSTSALTRDCFSGFSMSAGGGSDSAVIDSRYKPVRQGSLQIQFPRFNSPTNSAIRCMAILI